MTCFQRVTRSLLNLAITSARLKDAIFFLQTRVHHVASLNEIGAEGINQVPFSIFAKSSCYFLLARMKQSF